MLIYSAIHDLTRLTIPDVYHCVNTPFELNDARTLCPFIFMSFSSHKEKSPCFSIQCRSPIIQKAAIILCKTEWYNPVVYNHQSSSLATLQYSVLWTYKL